MWSSAVGGTNLPACRVAQPFSVMTALGFPPAVDRLYERVLKQSGRELVSVAQALLRTPEELLDDLAPLLEARWCASRGPRVFVESPPAAVARLVAEQATDAARARRRLDALAAAIPFLTARDGPAGAGGGARRRSRSTGRSAPAASRWR